MSGIAAIQPPVALTTVENLHYVHRSMSDDEDGPPVAYA